MSAVNVEREGAVTIVEIDRPEARNAVDGPTAALLADAFRAFERDESQSAAVLTGDIPALYRINPGARYFKTSMSSR